MARSKIRKQKLFWWFLKLNLENKCSEFPGTFNNLKEHYLNSFGVLFRIRITKPGLKPYRRQVGCGVPIPNAWWSKTTAIKADSNNISTRSIPDTDQSPNLVWFGLIQNLLTLLSRSSPLKWQRRWQTMAQFRRRHRLERSPLDTLQEVPPFLVWGHQEGSEIKNWLILRYELIIFSLFLEIIWSFFQTTDFQPYSPQQHSSAFSLRPKEAKMGTKALIERTRSNRVGDYTRRASTLPRKSSLYVKHHDQKRSGFKSQQKQQLQQFQDQHQQPVEVNHVNVVPVDQCQPTEAQYQTLPKSYRVSTDKKSKDKIDDGETKRIFLLSC